MEGNLCPQKGVEHALDYICNFLNFMVVGTNWRLYGRWAHSYSAGYRCYRVGDPTYSGTKRIVALGILFGEGGGFGKGVIGGS
jgi:hypothetical protein